jgi:hypothetical protein
MIKMTTYQANLYQIKLILESGLEPSEWIANYAKNFREIIDTLGIEDYEKIKAIIYLKKLKVRK